MKLVNISMVGNLTNALKENADFQRHDTFKEESVGQLPLISITKPEEWQVVVLILVVYLVFDLTWLFCVISDKKPTEQKWKTKKTARKARNEKGQKLSVSTRLGPRTIKEYDTRGGQQGACFLY